VEPVARLISISDVADLLKPTSPTGTVSRERADQISRRPTFPAPVQVGRTGRLWDEDEVRGWIATYRKVPGNKSTTQR
jgi:predicted DNA-binding transcriptional regulator AlpA